MDFKISKDIRGTQLHGKIYIKDEVLENFVIESFLCPGLVRCDFESVCLLFNKLKKGEYSVIEKLHCNDYKNNLFVHSLVILFFILLLAPIIFMAWLRGIPLI